VIRQVSIALRLTLVELAHNRFAMVLLAVYLPAWYGVIYGLTENASIGFQLRAFHVFVATSQHRLGLLTGMLNATTLIMGFVALSAVRRSALVDQRLVLCGYSQGALIGGRLLAFGVGSALLSIYAVFVLTAFTPPNHPVMVAAGVLGAVLTYAGIGVLAGVLARGDLEGFFFIIMLSLVDTFIQNPIANPAANRRVVEYFPSYFPMQVVVGAAIADRVAPQEFLGSLAWAGGLGVLGALGFWQRTKSGRAAGRRRPRPRR
jgi:hypothetical protein